MTDTSHRPLDGGFFSRPRASMASMAIAVVALVLAAAPYLQTGDFNGRVRAYLLANPQILDEVIRARDLRANTDRVRAINAAVAADPGVLAADALEPAFGPADAKVTVVEFFDYRCPYCKSAAPAYLALMQTHPDVRFIFKEWPVLDQGDDITSQYAARAALAAHAQGRYLAVHQALMAERALSPESVDRVLAQSGVEMERARAGLTSTDTSRLLANIHTGAASVGLQGTPTFFINGRMTATNNPVDLDRAIRTAKAG